MLLILWKPKILRLFTKLCRWTDPTFVKFSPVHAQNATTADRCDTQPPPQARKYSTAGPNTGPGLPHPTGHEPTQHVHYIVIDKQDNTCYTRMYGSLPSAHTPTDFVQTRSRPFTYTNTNNCSVLYHIYIAALINCIQPDDGHSSIDRNM